jgi:transcriptional regulator with XRE-family HTH domain
VFTLYGNGVRYTLSEYGNSVNGRCSVSVNSPESETLGTRLKVARTRAGLDQGRVAESLDVHRVTISKWENDVQTPSAEYLDQLADLYGVASRDLLRGIEVTDVVSREAPPDRITPRVSAGLPYRLRVWLQTELTEYAKAGASDHLFMEARSALEAPELIGFFVGGGGGETSEEDVLEDMKLMARAIRRRLRRSGAKLGPDPVE